MNRFATDTVTLHSRSAVVLAAIPAVRRRTVGSTRLGAAVKRLIARPFVAAKAARRAMRAENDESTRIALMRDGFSIDEGRPRGGAPRNLDAARYDVLRQIR
jgi:hypothetical protein